MPVAIAKNELDFDPAAFDWRAAKGARIPFARPAERLLRRSLRKVSV
jgi:hypothetical protein